MGSDFKYYIEIMLQWVSTLHPKIQPRIDQIGAELELSETLKLNFHEFFPVKLNLCGGAWRPPERYLGPCKFLAQ